MSSRKRSRRAQPVNSTLGLEAKQYRPNWRKSYESAMDENGNLRSRKAELEADLADAEKDLEAKPGWPGVVGGLLAGLAIGGLGLQLLLADSDSDVEFAIDEIRAEAVAYQFAHFSPDHGRFTWGPAHERVCTLFPGGSGHCQDTHENVSPAIGDDGKITLQQREPSSTGWSISYCADEAPCSVEWLTVTTP